ncbi:hypothetical protein C8R45DRAFT_918092 [Mycena sanguinolenta]|nr:hypothetical protein C8R45DRAFT_918092 [Mycena sanguinolenta]
MSRSCDSLDICVPFKLLIRQGLGELWLPRCVAQNCDGATDVEHVEEEGERREGEGAAEREFAEGGYFELQSALGSIREGKTLMKGGREGEHVHGESCRCIEISRENNAVLDPGKIRVFDIGEGRDENVVERVNWIERGGTGMFRDCGHREVLSYGKIGLPGKGLERNWSLQEHASGEGLKRLNLGALIALFPGPSQLRIAVLQQLLTRIVAIVGKIPLAISHPYGPKKDRKQLYSCRKIVDTTTRKCDITYWKIHGMPDRHGAFSASRLAEAIEAG